MKIGVVGCGALGSYYGAKLCRSGNEVHFLLRSDYEVVRRQGVNIQSIDGDFHVRPRCAREPGSIGLCELVAIGLKTTANAEFARLLPPLVGPETVIVTMQNGLGNEEQLERLFAREQIMGGLCFVCLNRVAPGIIHHTGYGDVMLGEYQRPAQERTHACAELFRRAGVTCQVTENLEKAHWEKLVWNIPFNGLGVAGVAGYEAVIHGQAPLGAQRRLCLATDELLADPNWLALIRELMWEVITTARAIGFAIPGDIVEHRIGRTRGMGAYKASTLIDYERGQPIERDSLFAEPLRRAQAAGVITPRLAALCQVLTQLDRPAR